MNTAELAVHAILARFADALARGDALGAAGCFAPDATYSEPPRFAFSGRDTIAAFFADFSARHREVSFTVARVLAAPDGQLAAAEWRFTYTGTLHPSTHPGTHPRTSDGARMVFEGMCWVELTPDDGLIARWRGFSARIEG